MGFGRSGTSLVGGILHQAGYFLGNDLYPPRISNPKGFFENALINGINERILKEYDFHLTHNHPTTPNGKYYSPYNPGNGHRWLSYISPDVLVDHVDPIVAVEIQNVLAKEGFAYKDPRFNFTLRIWEKFLQEDVAFICMFREPGVTVDSVLLECQTAEYLSDFFIDSDIAFTLWFNSYRHLLNDLSDIGLDRCIFVHYKQILSGQALIRLSESLRLPPLTSQFIAYELNRSRARIEMPKKVFLLYKELCTLAGYSD